ncbi:MAG: hypothetical protein JSV39_03140 [Candidatus Aenigmatarchaeota archaeon]|nr:MAG: hypothetical protein JSV39_03140 [Candidatus Aenigmarchaeota archaeon]
MLWRRMKGVMVTQMMILVIAIIILTLVFIFGLKTIELVFDYRSPFLDYFKFIGI